VAEYTARSNGEGTLVTARDVELDGLDSMDSREEGFRGGRRALRSAGGVREREGRVHEWFRECVPPLRLEVCRPFRPLPSRLPFRPLPSRLPFPSPHAGGSFNRRGSDDTAHRSTPEPKRLLRKISTMNSEWEDVRHVDPDHVPIPKDAEYDVDGMQVREKGRDQEEVGRGERGAGRGGGNGRIMGARGGGGGRPRRLHWTSLKRFRCISSPSPAHLLSPLSDRKGHDRQPVWLVRL
jgi:hypothetical protein